MHATNRLAPLIAASLFAIANASAATFTYHGSLQDGGKPAEGQYDLELTLYPSRDGGSAIGGPLTMFAVPVRDGSFSAEVDFGPLTPLRGDAWLAVKVRPAGNNEAFAPLATRAAVTAATTASVCPGAWDLGGNAGNPVGSYLGTADAQPLIFKVNGAQVGQFTTNGNLAINSAPIDTLTELTVAGNATGGGGYANLFMHQNGINDGMLLSTGQATAGANNANFYIDNYNGSVQERRLAVLGNGTVGINTPPINGNVELTIASNGDPHANLFMRQGNNGANNAGILLSVGDASASGNDAAFTLDQFNGTQLARRLVVAGNGAVGINTETQLNGTPVGSGVESLTIGSLLGTGNNGFTSSSLAIKTAYSSGVVMYSEQLSTFWPVTLGFYTVERDGSSKSLFRSSFYGTGLNGASDLGAGALNVGTDATNGNGAYLTLGGVWTNTSSRGLKEAFAHVDAGKILDKLIALPITTWQYKNDAAEGTHLGPVAEDFKAAFDLGNDERHIATVDEEGVALAAIQGLNTRLQAQNAALRTGLKRLEQRLDAIERGAH